jgi:predicted Zn-dependent peptidase
MIKYSFSTLNFGLPLIKIPMRSIESVTVLVLVNTGSRYEKPKQQGIAHFFEHMVSKGTDKYPAAMDLATAVDSVGADFNAFTSKEYTGYYVKAAADHIELALDIVSEMLLKPQLRQEDIDREKGVIIEELNMYVDSPMRHIANLFDRMVYHGSGLSHDIIGNKETIRAIQSADFRQFLMQWYGLSNMVLVVAGKEEIVESASTLDLIREKFSKETEERIKNRVKIDNLISPNPISQEKLHVEFRQTEQAHLVLGWPSIKRHDDRKYMLSLLSIIMGGNMSSRLFDEVREKRALCYYVNSDVDQFHDGGTFGASAGVDPKRVEEALKVIANEFRAIIDATKPITQLELQRAKDYLIGKMVLNFENSGAIAQYYGLKQLLLGEIEPFEDVVAKVKAVTLEDVNSLAKALIMENQMRLAVIGPFKEKEKFSKIIAS